MTAAKPPAALRPSAFESPTGSRSRASGWGAGCRGVVIAAAIIGLIWIAEATVLPWLVTREVGSALNSLGFSHTSFTVRDVSLTRAVVAQIAGTGQDDPTINAAVIRYNISGVIRGKLDTIELTGARLVVDAQRRQIILGRSVVECPQPSTSSAGQSFPFAQVIFHSCDLVLRNSGRDYWVPFSGTVATDGDQKLKIALVAYSEGATVALDGTANAGGDADLAMKVNQLDLAALFSAVSNYVGSSVRVNGMADAQIGYHRAGAESSAHLVVSPRHVVVYVPVGSHRLSFHDLDGSVEASVDSKGGLSSLAGQISLGGANFDQQALGGTQISLNTEMDKSEPVVHFLLQAMGISVPAARLEIREIITDLRLNLPAGEQPLGAGTFVRGTVKLGAVDLAGYYLRGNDVSEPIATVSLAAGRDDTGYAVTINPGSMITVPAAKFGPATVHLPNMTLSGDGHFGGTSPQWAGAAVHLDKASVEVDGGELAIGDITGDLPIRWNTNSWNIGNLALNQLHLGSLVLPGITASAGIDKTRLGIEAHWPILKGAQVNANATMDLVQAQGELKWELPEFKLTDPDAIAAVVPAVKGASITGTFSAKGDIKLAASKLTPSLNVSLADVVVDDKAYAARLDGLGTSVTADGFSPLTTPGNQQLTIKQAKVGKLEVANGSVGFRVESAHSILIEKSRWDWEGGTLHTDAFRINPTAPTLVFTLDGFDLNLKSVLATFSPGQASGDGRIYGRFPVRVEWPRISFGKGFLYSAPGPGTVQLDPSMASKMGDLLDSSDPRFKTDDQFKQVKQRALQAMRDFQYDVLKVDWNNTPDGVVGTLHLEGKGRQGPSGQALNLNINFQNLDRALCAISSSAKEPAARHENHNTYSNFEHRGEAGVDGRHPADRPGGVRARARRSAGGQADHAQRQRQICR